MRARWLKPEFFRDKKMGAAGPIVALVYEALWCLADDSGVVPCDPESVKGEMFVWWSAVGVPEITGALRHLSEQKIICLFQSGDDLFCRIRSFTRHQSIHKPSKFRYPKEGQAVTWNGAALVPESSGTPPALPASYTPRLLDTTTTTTRARAKPEEVGDVARRLTIAANRATMDRFGEQANPLIASSGPAHKLAEAVLAADVPLDFAEQSVVRQVVALPEPVVSSMAYFRAGILHDWQKQGERSAAMAASPIRPLDQPSRPSPDHAPYMSQEEFQAWENRPFLEKKG